MRILESVGTIVHTRWLNLAKDDYLDAEKFNPHTSDKVDYLNCSILRETKYNNNLVL